MSPSSEQGIFVYNGGNGRNVNYQIDGGDNNDDTVGGLLQLFPLEAIQEFNFQTQRFNAEFGRTSGGVMNRTCAAPCPAMSAPEAAVEIVTSSTASSRGLTRVNMPSHVFA